jgi:hypothetical protein
MAKNTVAKAMKQIARTKGKIADLTNRMIKCVNTIDTNNFIEDYATLETTRKEQVALLIDLKNKVMKVNIKHNMFETILTLSERKNEIDFLRGLEVKQGVFTDRYRDTTATYKTQVEPQARTKRIDELQDEINELTDTLDAFNATTVLK